MLMVIAAALFVAPGEPSLQERSLELTREELLSENVQGEIDEMFCVARGEREDLEKQVMVGLAAIQIGIPKRLILVDLGVASEKKELGELTLFANPEIVWQSIEEEIGKEGCYSVDSHICGLVPRAQNIKIRAWDRYGNVVEEEMSGFTARIFQHEVDHLDGIRFPDRVGSEGVLHWIEGDEYLEYRNNWENWPKYCPWDLWIAMKNAAI